MNWTDLLSNKRYAQPHKSADIRSSFQRDYDRIIFSSPFRRLQNKTQVFPLPGAQTVHNRLTHSLEVASVGRSIACRTVEKLSKKDDYLKERQSDIETIVASACLAHDLGNPPFGHSGEDTISSFFNDWKGMELKDKVLPEQWSDLIAFEGNANAFRQLTHQFTGRRAGGFSLTAATLATLLKYPYPSFDKGDRKKYNVFYSEIEAFKEVVEECGIPRIDDEHLVYARHPLSFMMEAADDICYLVLDMEDAHRRGIVSTEAIEKCFLSFFNPKNTKDMSFYKHKEEAYLDVTDINERIAFLRATLINKLVNCVSDIFVKNYEPIMEGRFEKSLISHLPEYEKNALDQCRKASIEHIYRHPSVVKIELTGFNVIGSLMEVFIGAILYPDTPYNKKLLSLIPEQFKVATDDTYTRVQSVIDFISNMTDLYAVKLYKDLSGID
ncbi:MAG: deoxyguanosinetriphosphate triphosphohydrolase [Bacteroidales bacterium]|nr:deoxyguanosinetriphosphate triphosphohydrolase [Bacteroidales bacterium]